MSLGGTVISCSGESIEFENSDTLDTNYDSAGDIIMSKLQAIESAVDGNLEVRVSVKLQVTREIGDA